MLFVCSCVSSPGCERRNTGLGLFQYAPVQRWAGSDGWEGMCLVSGLQLFNLWRIIRWRWLQFVALGGGESNRCNTKRYPLHPSRCCRGRRRYYSHITMQHETPLWTVSCMWWVLASKLPFCVIYVDFETGIPSEFESSTIYPGLVIQSPSYTYSNMCGHGVSGWGLTYCCSHYVK